MSLRFRIIAVLLAATALLTACASEPHSSIVAPTAKSLSEHPPIGELGLPLGTMAEIRATVVGEGGASKTGRSYRLQVTEVNGQPLPQPVSLEFCKESFIPVDIASEPFALYEMKHGKETGSLNESQIAELEKEYVGRRMHLLVYETGGYSGVARNMPEDLAIWQDHAFAFSTQLVILGRKP
ncbi:MAG: hypothetical protein WC058_03855 [Phycisphaeraceae bacterium]